MDADRRHSETGAVFIHVAIGLLVLLMFIAWVADFGLLMVSRNHAQNSADAGALAGASALSFDNDAADRWDRAREVAWHAAHFNKVWADGPGAVPTSPYSGPPCALVPERCVRVDVYRDGTNGSALLPTWFGSLFNLTSQSTRAMAVAESAPASGTNCMKPWLIPDRWNEASGNPDVFDAPGDTYTRPRILEDGTMDYGSGWTPDDIGTQLLLKPGNPHGAISPSDFYEIEDATNYEEAIYGCELTQSIGDTVTALPGNRVGPTRSGLEELLARNGGSALVVIGMFNPEAFAAQDRNSGTFPLEIVNLLAFRVEEMQGGNIYGTIVGAPSSMATVCPVGTACPTSTGLVSVIRLVR
jgi:hypothetical protein